MEGQVKSKAIVVVRQVQDGLARTSSVGHYEAACSM